MSKKYLLPPLSEENEIKSENCWEDYTNPYSFLIQKMKLQNEPNTSIFEGGSNAVPHVFEQMIVFHDAFLDEKHPEHERAVMEWRSILILLALQRIQNIEISLKKVEFNKNSQNPFLSAATMFIPEDLPVFYQTTWDFLYIICLKGKPVALVSPVTLVCPSKQFMKKISDWMDDPIISLEKVNGKEEMFLKVENKGLVYHNLSLWFKNLCSKLSCSMPKNSEVNRRAQRVKEELERYVKECEKEVVDKTEVKFKSDIYPVMNNNIRNEYEFLNFCCDFVVKNKKLEFLVERYQEDIFENNLAILVKDKMPDTMEQPENIKILEEVFPNVLRLGGKSVIFVEKHSGERVAACVLLPFKTRFVQELIERHIIAEEFFEKFSAVYDEERAVIKVSLQISEFLYDFRKVYTREQWRYMYADDIPTVYVWPKAQMKAQDWKVYYTYVENNKTVKLSVPMNKGSVVYRDLTNSGEKQLFQLIRTSSYSTYLQFYNNDANGYLPIKTSYEGFDSVGKVLEVFIDIGHATTYINMVKMVSDNQYEYVPFIIPKSLKIAGNDVENSVSGNFVSGSSRLKYIKNMLHSFRNYDAQEENVEGLSPFSAGQILFDPYAYCRNDSDVQISFFNFEYYNNDQAERENIHAFIEQLLLYVAYQAQNIDCSYLKIHFLHNFAINHTYYGEILGLWENVLGWVKAWTGIRSAYSIDIDGLEEYQALTYSTYLSASKQKGISEEELYVGVDIGWKKTLISYFKGIDLGKTDNLKAYYSRIEYAGCDISLMKDDVLSGQEFFALYSQMLSIFLTGSITYTENKKFGKILECFEQYCKGMDRQHDAYYQGIFDLLAMMIEEELPKHSIDIYHNMPEFRKFIGMLTYNICLIFLNVGCLLGKIGEEERKAKKVILYLSGNGSKFLHWISNLKRVSLINDNNCQNVFIIKMQKNILEIIEMGIKITSEQAELPEEICILLSEEPKEQIIKGYMFKESFRQEKKEEDSDKNSIYCPKFEPEEVKNIFMNEIQQNKFNAVSNELRKDIFEEEQEPEEPVNKDGEQGNKGETLKDKSIQYTLSIDELVSEKSKMVCRDIIKNIHKMQNRKDE